MFSLIRSIDKLAIDFARVDTLAGSLRHSETAQVVSYLEVWFHAAWLE